MPAESVAIAENPVTCTARPEILEKHRVWMRLCPLCQAVLCGLPGWAGALRLRMGVAGLRWRGRLRPRRGESAHLLG